VEYEFPSPRPRPDRTLSYVHTMLHVGAACLLASVIAQPAQLKYLGHVNMSLPYACRVTALYLLIRAVVLLHAPTD
jgi:hypothetical protein